MLAHSRTDTARILPRTLNSIRTAGLWGGCSMSMAMRTISASRRYRKGTLIMLRESPLRHQPLAAELVSASGLLAPQRLTFTPGYPSGCPPHLATHTPSPANSSRFGLPPSSRSSSCLQVVLPTLWGLPAHPPASSPLPLSLPPGYLSFTSRLPFLSAYPTPAPGCPVRYPRPICWPQGLRVSLERIQDDAYVS